MAGHSKFKNIMHRKSAQDLKKASSFSRLSKDIIIAARLGGGNVALNARLKNAIKNAKQGSLPRERIEKAIAIGSGNTSSENSYELQFEVKSPYGVMMIIQCIADNSNRVISYVKSFFHKRGYTVMSQNSIIFLFHHYGYVSLTYRTMPEDTVFFDYAMKYNFVDYICNGNDVTFYCIYDNLRSAVAIIDESNAERSSYGVMYKAKDHIPVSRENMMSLENTIDVLYSDDSVVSVYHNGIVEE